MGVGAKKRLFQFYSCVFWSALLSPTTVPSLYLYSISETLGEGRLAGLRQPLGYMAGHMGQGLDFSPLSPLRNLRGFPASRAFYFHPVLFIF